MRRNLLLGALLCPLALAQSVSGLWDASVTVNGLEIPFRMEFSGSGADVQGSFFNGDEKVTSTSGRLESGTLLLKFDYYAATLNATLAAGSMSGIYVRANRPYPFHAKPHAVSHDAPVDAPSIAGLWEVATRSSKGESAWHLIVRQSGADVSAAILRVDGDTGTLTGAYRDGKFVLSHFSGARPSLLELTPQPDGSLDVVQNGRNRMTALRPAAARARDLPEPTDPARHTTVRDPNEPFHFRFPDLDGHLVADTDLRFRHKVVIVAISGSWCPNCHDEAPFLEEFYRKYHALGLEIVALSFEEAGQLENPSRLRAFVRKYGIEYPVLIAGEPADLHARLPQAVNLDAWPTTFFLGRDGRVRAVHAGFPGRASGEFHRQIVAEVQALIERLLKAAS